jgi:hypothetical protein
MRSNFVTNLCRNPGISKGFTYYFLPLYMVIEKSMRRVMSFHVVCRAVFSHSYDRMTGMTWGNGVFPCRFNGTWQVSVVWAVCFNCWLTIRTRMSNKHSHLTPHTSHLTPLTSHLSPLTSHLSPLTSHLSPHTSHLTPHTSHLTPHTTTVSWFLSWFLMRFTNTSTHLTAVLADLQCLQKVFTPLDFFHILLCYSLN